MNRSNFGQKFSRRIETVLRMVDLKREEDAEDLAIWEWLHGLLDGLGEDGMSSEESDIDMRTGMEVYYAKAMTWRKNVDREMRLIDGQRLKDKQLYSRKGANPVQRIRNNTKGETRRQAARGLPKSFYDKKWLTAQSQASHRDLDISKKKFQWMTIY